MNDKSPEEWKYHIRSIILQNMKYSIEALCVDDMPDHVFNFMMQSLQNGIRFLTNERLDKSKEFHKNLEDIIAKCHPNSENWLKDG